MPETATPTVSVVIPVHNGMPFLPETLASVLAQTRAADEIVIIENGSTDGTGAWLAAQSDPRLRVVVQESTVGPAANWTRAVEESTGDLVKLLCADDILEPGALREQSDALMAHPAAVLAASRRRIVDDNGATIAANRGLGPLRGEVGGREAVLACVLRGQNLFGEPACVLFRRDALLKALPWDDSLPYVIDLDMYSRVLEHGSSVMLPASQARFRVSGSSWSANLSSVQREQVDGWVDRVVASGAVTLSPVQRVRARTMSRVQWMMRAVAFRVVALRAARRKTAPSA